MTTTPIPNRDRARRGFTLLELIVVVGIGAMLFVTSFGLFGVLKKKAMMSRELSAARNLMTSFHLFSADNGGKILPGYQSDEDAVNENDELLSAPANARYPWRIYPYLDDVEGSLLFNGNEEVMKEKDSDYLVSVSPNLGMNTTFIGGHYGSGSLLRPSRRIEDVVGRFAIRHTSDIRHASDLIVFLSARGDPQESWEGRGYFEVQPPNVMGAVWSRAEWEIDAIPSEHGFVDLRWNGKAVAAMLDGSARTFDEEELRDMRHWSPEAADSGDAEYFVGKPRSVGGGTSGGTRTDDYPEDPVE